MHQKEGLQFRSFLPLVVAALEGADNQLRETAKASIVSLFRYGILFLSFQGIPSVD